MIARNEYYLKNREKLKKEALSSYYKNRDKRIKYQREYDKKNKDKKRLQDAKRYGTEEYNTKERCRHYSKRNHYPILLKKYGSCQKCSSKEGLQIHHKKYTKDIKDCLLLCKRCHKKEHIKEI